MVGLRSMRYAALLSSLLVAGWAQAESKPDTTTDQPIKTAKGEQTTDFVAGGSTEIIHESGSSQRPDPALVAPTIGGLSGLVRLVTSDVGATHSFRISLHAELFKSDNFLVNGDSNSRFAGTIAANYTPWEYLEFFLNLRSMANNNDRISEPGRLDQAVILSLGDISFGGKFRWDKFHPSIAVGANVAVTLLNSVGGVAIDGDSTSFYGGVFTSFDLQKLIEQVPVRLHVNAGYMLDNSSNLANFSPGYSVASLQVEKFALGINASRVQLKVGIDASLRKWTKIGVTPILEFGLDIATGDADADFVGRVAQADLDGIFTSWLTAGVRVAPCRGLNVLLASDIGLVSPGFGYGPPVVPWNILVGVSYGYDPIQPTKTVVRERVNTVIRGAEKESAPQTGKLRGRVVSADGSEPITGAVVIFPGNDLTGLSTDPDGGFLSYAFPPGKLPIMIRHPGYVSKKVTAQITAGKANEIEIQLTPAAPKNGTLIATVRDRKGNGVAASLVISGVENRTLRSNDKGELRATLKPGRYSVSVQSDGFLRREQTVAIVANSTQNLALTLTRRPKKPMVKVTKRRIVIRRQVHFASGTADLKPDSLQILDLVADALVRNPQITKVEIQGHTDNRGSRKRNMRLSQARAEAVMTYLLDRGIKASRLIAKGYGPNRPKRPNFSARNRALNRRVEFLIRNN